MLQIGRINENEVAVAKGFMKVALRHITDPILKSQAGTERPVTEAEVGSIIYRRLVGFSTHCANRELGDLSA